jgi:rSAM/selenodomain-associated transferase 1
MDFAHAAAHATTGIAVMAKAPRAGQCKTRLQPCLAPAQAAAMSAAFLGDITENLASAARHAPIAPYIAYAPAGSEALFDGIPAHGTHLFLADGSRPAPAGVEKFGRCLLHAIEAMLEFGHAAACVLNSDSPTLPTRLLVQAHAALAAPGDRVVMGAAEDGGYYLLGMKRAHAALLTEIDWSTERVADQTRARAASAGLEIVELDPWYDVDDPGSLARLVAELRPDRPTSRDIFPASRTSACLATMGFFAAEMLATSGAAA